MKSWFRLGLALVAISIMVPANAQDVVRDVVITENTDYPGFDLRAEKEVSIDECRQACIDDAQCRAFTYNSKARWCFLKTDFRDSAPFEGAISGKIVETALEPDLGAPPALAYVPSYLSTEARLYLKRATASAERDGVEASPELLSAMRTAMNTRNFAASEEAALAAIGSDPQNFDNWLELAGFATAYANSNADGSYRMRDIAAFAALNAYELSRTASKRAAALAALGKAFEARSEYRSAINSYKASLEIVDSPEIASRYRSARSSWGFRITGNTVDADILEPRACVEFSEELVKDGVDYNNFITLDGKPAAVDASGRRICIDGLEHGKSYAITVRSGLPSSVDESLEEPAVFNIYVRDRAPSVRFTGENFVLPEAARQGIPVVGINADTADLVLYRVNDRALAALLSRSQFLTQMEGYSLDTLKDELGEPVWEGKLDLSRELNRETVTSLPLEKVLPERKPGIYVLTATVDGKETDSWEPRATQWFLVSDIGLATYDGNDGLTVFTRSLDTAGPLAGVELTLIARNNEVLGTAQSDARGVARFDAGLLRGSAGLAPAAVTAVKRGEKGNDYVFLDLSRAGFDLSDRGVTGRAAPGPVDIFAYLDRGIYRLGETVHAMALARDDSAGAAESLPLTIVFERPDGVEAARIVSNAPSAGGHLADFDLPSNGMRGVWKLLAYTDPDSDPVAEKLFLVEDFVPDRIEFDLTNKTPAISEESPAEIEVAGRYLYGAPAADLAIEGEMRIKNLRTLEAAPGFYFGLANEDTSASEARPLADLPRTDADGKALVSVSLGTIPASTTPQIADIAIRMREDGGRAVERKTSVPVKRPGLLIGIKPDFGDGSVKENSQAGFRVIAVDENGQRQDLSGASWSLFRIERNYQWYRDGSWWRYESVDIPRLEASGTIDIATGDPAAISVPVKWGQYLLEVASPEADGPVSSHSFDAGYYVLQQSAQTPDALEIALDKENYAAGEVAKLRVSPRYAGQMLVVVGSDRVFETLDVNVPAEGTEVEIPVKAEWGAGAYVTATLFRPGSAEASRLPARAIGTKWLQVSPGDRELKLSMKLPDRMRPDERLSIPVTVAGARPGEDAFVTVAAVDVGILNLTRYEAPDPVKWYFGQRELGLEIRDMYGNLIDGSQGAFGNVRTGGDGPALSAEGSPPTEKLLALFSGIVKVGPDGKALVEFDLPPFNGTARVMAVGWTRSGVGSASGDVIIRDPVVISASLPKVLAPGDEARILVEIANTDGPAGKYDLSASAAGGLTLGTFPPAIDLAQGERKTFELPVKAVTPDNAQLSITAASGSDLMVTRTQSVEIRPATLPVTTKMEIPVAAGGSLSVGSDLLAQSYPDGASVSVRLSRTPGFDVAAILATLDRYPYGCAEQTTSRALPLLYLSDLDAPKELLETPDLAKRLDGAIARVLSYQSSSGSFGLWGPDDRDMWLDAYVTDFLTRAREKGYAVPEQSMRLALDNLQNKLGYEDDVTSNGNAIAYSLYVLARNRMASAADLRYYADTRIEEFVSPLARAHIAAALSLYNEVERSSRTYGSALELASTSTSHNFSGYDYGSKLRDGAAMLALASEAAPAPANVPQMMDFVVRELSAKQYTSTQEQAWMLLAARATQEMNSKLEFAVNGEPRKGALAMSLSGSELEAEPVRIENLSGEPLTATVTTLASPLQPLPSGGNGFEITREFFTLDGEPADITQAKQNERYVVVLTVEEDNDQASRVLVTDLLPGGLEIDNPRLVESADIEAFGWIGETEVAHTEFRSDRFVAAINNDEGGGGSYTFAYVVRAVTPGTYTLPAASVEDMYRPELSARTATGFMQVGAGQ